LQARAAAEPSSGSARIGYAPTLDTIAGVPARLHFTDSDKANTPIATDPMALPIGFALDQHWSVQS
jgi:hypothetical protein